MKSFLAFVWRLFFGISLICLGIKGMTLDFSKNMGIMDTNLARFSQEFHFQQFYDTFLNDQIHNFVYAYAFFLIATGLFKIFNFCFAKVWGVCWIILKLSLLSNIYFYRNQETITCASVNLGVLAGVFS